jgi:hypothetical protein
MKTLLISMLITASCANAAEIYVSPKGSDAARGTAEAPLKTLERAQDAARQARKAAPGKPVEVILMPGTYVRTESFLLGPDDSGTKDAPTVYRAGKPGTVNLIGARTVKLSDFQKVKDPAILDRLDPAARDHVVCISVKGMRNIGPFPDVFTDHGGLLEVFSGGKRLPLSRWPDGDAVTKMGKVLKNGSPTEGGGAFQYKDKRPERWLNNDNVWLKGQWRVGWDDPAIKVASIEEKTTTITFAKGIHLGIGAKHSGKGGRRPGNQKEPWFAINLLEEITLPGEWALDFSTGTLYLWPPKTPDTTVRITQLGEPLIMVKGAKHLQFIGLTLEETVGDGIVLDEVEDCLVAGLTVRNLGARGIVANGYRVIIQSNDVYDVGKGAVYISGGNRPKLTMSNNKVINNHLHHYGVLQNQYSAGIHVGPIGRMERGESRDAVGILVAHNAVHHAPRDAILYNGNDNTYEYNEFYYCGYNTKDTGVFYSNLDWTMRGNVIRYNYIHNTIGGINPDDGASGNHAYGNIFRGNSTGVWIASGPDNVIEHNIFIKDKGAVFAIDARGLQRGYNAKNRHLMERLNQVNPGQEPWKSKYPELNGMLENKPELPWRTRFVGNLIVCKQYKAPMIQLGRYQDNPEVLLMKDNYVTADDPGFVDARAGDYTLKKDSIVFTKIPGFKPIPFKEMGLKIDAYRTRLPTDEEAGRRPEDNPYKRETGDFGT